MDKQPVGQLPDLTQSNNDDEIMVITNDEYNQLKKEKISDFITDLTSTDENNAIVKGTDGKLFTKDFGNASNITEGTLPVSVLPDIPKDKLPEIETDDLPDSGITAGTYTYPTDIVVNSKGQVTSITEGQAGANNANQDLSNLGPLGLDKINQSKALETGSVSSDADVYADVLKYAHSTFDKSKFEVVGSPTITDDGIASGFSNSNYITYNKQTLGDNFDIIFPKFKTPDVNQDTNYLFSTSGHGLRVQLNSGKIRTLAFYGDDQYPVIQGLTQLQNNTEYLYKISRKKESDNYVLTAFLSNDNGKTWVQQSQITMTQDLYNSNSVGYLGGNPNSADQIFKGSIDLKSIAIWSGGIPVFNGNKTGTDTIDEIEIPYTLSKTGSKIVDAAYRDRVQDMYEQYGYAPYYTIDEENENFTLPMGEIYGMIQSNNNNTNNCVKKTGDTMTGNLIINKIETSGDTSTPLQVRMNKAANYGNTTYGNINFADNDGKYISFIGGLQKTNGAGGVRLGAWGAGNQFKELLLLTTDDNPAIIIKSYQNGKSGYIIYSNKLCKQWGYATYPGGPFVNFDVHLTISYKDTNYIVLTMAVGSNNSGDSSAFRLISQATNSFNMKYVGSGNNYGSVSGGNWFTIGYIS